MIGALINQTESVQLKFGLTQVLNCNSRLSRWNNSGGGGGIVKGAFDNQALNTLFNYGCRGLRYSLDLMELSYKAFPFSKSIRAEIASIPADRCDSRADVFITDPPYGDAVKYEEILDFFIGWLRRNPPANVQHFS